MGRNVSTESSALGIITATAGDTIVANDLVLNNESGYVNSAYSLAGIENLNNNSTVPTAILALGTLFNNSGGPQSQSRRICEFDNGNVAIIYTGNQSSTALNSLKIQILSQTGSAITPPILVSSDTALAASGANNNTGSIRLIKLNSTQCVVAWVGSTFVLKFAIVNNDGTIAVAAVSGPTLTSSAWSQWNIDALVAGTFVIAYRKVTSNDCSFSRYNASGVLQGTETTIEAASTPINPVVKACANGDFVVSYYRTAATAAYKFARYNSSGTIQGSLTTVFTGASILDYGEQSGGVAELTGGNIVFATSSGGTTNPDIYVYSSSNVLVKAIDPGIASLTVNGFLANEVPPINALPDGGFSAIGRNYLGTGCIFGKYNSSGVPIINLKPVLSIALLNSADADPVQGSGVKCIYRPSIGFIVDVTASGGGAGAPDYNNLFILSDNGIKRGTLVTHGSVVAGMDILLTKSNYIFLMDHNYVSNNGISLGVYNVSKRSILGVALDSATYGQTPRIATQGNFTINQNFNGTQYADTRTNTAPGTKATIINNQAILSGL